MRGSPTSDTEKNPRKIERGKFINPPRPMGRRSKKGATVEDVLV